MGSAETKNNMNYSIYKMVLIRLFLRCLAIANNTIEFIGNTRRSSNSHILNRRSSSMIFCYALLGIVLGFQDITLAKAHMDGIVATKAISIGKYKNQLSQATRSNSFPCDYLNREKLEKYN